VTRREWWIPLDVMQPSSPTRLPFWFWRVSLFRQSEFTSLSYDALLSLNRPINPLVHHRIEALSDRNIVPKASHVLLPSRTLG